MARDTELERERTAGRGAGRDAGAPGEEMGEPEELETMAEDDDGAGVSGRDVGLFGAGMGVGLLLGAGIALLLAPRSGAEIRRLIGTSARRVGHRVADRVEDIRGEMRSAARRGGRKMRRGMTRGRWRMEDVAERWR